VEYDDFQEAVLDIAEGGARITKGGVALRLKLEPATAGAMLDRMTRDGALELDVDERSGEIFYEVPRRRPAPRAGGGGAGKALAGLGKALDEGALAVKVGSVLMAAKTGAVGSALPAERRRRIAVGVLAGALLPGVGLAYAAPWPVVLAASAVFLVGYKLIALIPFLSSVLLFPFVVVCVVVSAVLGGLYTWQYNRAGKRAPLGDEPLSPKQLLKRLGK
jgi:hypothetical protein